MVQVAAAVCAVAPDLDVVTLRFGVPYESMLGHRGITHSLAFAAVLGAAAASALRARCRELPFATLWLYLFAATASHGLFDALTDGGRGVAFFAPFSATRWFFPVRPIRVSPIGVERFLGARGIAVLESELAWVWLPSLLFALVVLGARRVRAPSRR